MADIIFPGQTPTGTLGTSKLPNNMDLVIWQGDAQTYYIVLQGDAAVPIDITAYTPRAVIRSSFNDPVVYEWECTVPDPTNGTVHIYLSSGVCAGINPGNYIWSFELHAGPNSELYGVNSGDVRTYLAGDVTVYAKVEN
jgi:hypothetical protein